MPKKSVTKYKYIEFLVTKIKRCHKNNEKFDEYFDELITLYSPLIYRICKRVRAKCETNLQIPEIRLRVIESVFDAILRYTDGYEDGRENSKGFDKIYFSQYLKIKLGWDVHRYLNPTKIEHEDSKNQKYVDIDKTDVYETLSYIPTKPISDNFISLCRLAQKKIKDDLCADYMMLNFGYDFKNSELASVFAVNSRELAPIDKKLKDFWKEEQNLEKLL